MGGRIDKTLSTDIMMITLFDLTSLIDGEGVKFYPTGWEFSADFL